MLSREDRKAKEDKRLARYYIALASLIAWARYPHHSDRATQPEPVADAWLHAAHVRAILDELDRHADRSADVLRQASENESLRTTNRQYAAELNRLRAELFKLNISQGNTSGQAKTEASGRADPNGTG